MRTRGLAAILALMVALVLGTAIAAQTPPPVGGTLNGPQLEQLVAPIALYPDELVAQILAAATYPSQLVEANNFLQSNGNQDPADLANAVNQQDWDDSVKSLTEYPDVLADLAQNLAWTSALGDAYYNQPDDVMTAVQTLRLRAYAAGTLRTSPQLTVIDQNGIISLEPGNPDVLYVPSYDAWTVYGSPLLPWPGYVLGPGIATRPGIFFGIGFNLGVYSRFGWGARGWRPDWGGHRIVHNGQPFVSQSPTFFNRGGTAGRAPGPLHNGARFRPGAAAPAGARPAPQPGRPAPQPVRPAPQPGRPAPQPARPQPGRPGPTPARPAAPTPAPANPRAIRGFTPQPRPASGTRSSAFSGINHASVAASNSARGQSSLGRAPAPRPAPAARPAPTPHPAPPGRGRGPGGGQA